MIYNEFLIVHVVGALTALVHLWLGILPNWLIVPAFMAISVMAVSKIGQIGSLVLALKKSKNEDAFKLAEEILLDARFRDETVTQFIAVIVGLISCFFMIASSFFGLIVLTSIFVLFFYMEVSGPRLRAKYKTKLDQLK